MKTDFLGYFEAVPDFEVFNLRQYLHVTAISKNINNELPDYKIGDFRLEKFQQKNIENRAFPTCLPTLGPV